MDSTIDALERLGALHRAGSLTDDEYAAQKARLLGQAPPMQPAPATPIAIESAVEAEARLSEAWRRRFAFFRAYGSPYSPTGAAALRTLSFWRATWIRLNVWALLFGPIYFAILGLWKRAISLTVAAIVAQMIAERFFGETASRAVGLGFALLFAMTANYARFIKVTQGRDEWNPFADFTDGPSGRGGL